MKIKLFFHLYLRPIEMFQNVLKRVFFRSCLFSIRFIHGVGGNLFSSLYISNLFTFRLIKVEGRSKQNVAF